MMLHKIIATLPILLLLSATISVAGKVETRTFMGGKEVKKSVIATIKKKNPEFASISSRSLISDLVMVETKDHLYGFVNQNGDIVIPPIYRSFNRTCGSQIIVAKTNVNLVHFYNEKFPNIHFIENSPMTAVEDKSLKRLSGFDYDWVDIETGLAKTNGEYGSIDANGIFHIKEELKGFRALGNKLGFNPMVTNEGKVGMINEKLEFTIPVYDSIQLFPRVPQAIVKLQGRYGIVTQGVISDSEIVLYDKLTPIYKFELYPAVITNVLSCRETIEMEYIKIESDEYHFDGYPCWSSDLFCFKAEKDGKSFYIDINGTKILDTDVVENEIDNNKNKVFKEDEPECSAEYMGKWHNHPELFETDAPNLYIILESDIDSLISNRKNCKNMEGTVDVRLVINKDGSISDITIDSSSNKDLEREAFRIVRQLDKWKPATISGMNVRSSKTIKINFSPLKQYTIYLPSETEHKAKYKGGRKQLNKDIVSLVKKYSHGKTRSGWVEVKFVVNEDGTTSDATIERSSDNKEMDSDAIDIVEELSGWIPATIEKVKVKSFKTLKIIF